MPGRVHEAMMLAELNPVCRALRNTLLNQLLLALRLAIQELGANIYTT